MKIDPKLDKKLSSQIGFGYDELRILGLTPTEIRILGYMLEMPEGEWVTSVQITKDLGIVQSEISTAMRLQKQYGWVESAIKKGYRRTKSAEWIRDKLRKLVSDSDKGEETAVVV